MTNEQRNKAIEALAQKWAEDMDIDSLMEYYVNGQEEYLDTISDVELAEYLEDNELEELFDELADKEEEQRRDEKNGLYPDQWDEAN